MSKEDTDTWVRVTVESLPQMNASLRAMIENFRQRLADVDLIRSHPDHPVIIRTRELLDATAIVVSSVRAFCEESMTLTAEYDRVVGELRAVFDEN